MFAEDEDNTLWTSGGGQVVGWLNTRMFEETGDEEASQGWSPLILDTNGNGKQDEWVEPNEPIDPSKDKRITSGYYAVAYNPGRRLDLGHVSGIPGRRRSLRPGDRSHGVLPTTLGQPGRSSAGLLAARRRHRS